MSTRYRIMWGLVCVVMGIGSPAWAEDGSAGVSEKSYADFMGNEVLDLQDLAEGAEIQRRMFNRITPSGFSWLQPMFPSVVPFDAKYFDEAFLNGLLGEEANSVAVYPLSLVLDPKTRETLIYNAEGELIAAVPADGVSRTWPDETDPARVTLRLDLLPSENVESYLYAEDRVAEFVASKSAKTPKAGGVIMMNMMVGSTNFGILSFQRLTNGNMQLTVTNGTGVAEVFSYTVVHTSSVTTNEWVDEFGVTNISTNTLWTPVSPTFNGLESDWECRETNLVLTFGAGSWEDTNITSNDRVRFYGVAKMADGDWDGLTDGAELFVHHTSPTNRDTDADGWSDAEELVEETDPLDRFSAARLARGVVIHALSYNPSNGAAASNQWIQLHSSSASPVNLGDFRLQVAGSNFATKISFSSNTWIQPGQFILVGGSNVEGRDYSADLDLPNSYPTNPTAGARLVGPEGMESNPADVVMYGTHTPFNEGGLPTNGWASTNTDLWAGRSNQLVRTRLGLDNDLRSDWTYRLVGELWNSLSVMDTDGDGLNDGKEYSGSSANGVQSDPLDPDTDDDGLEDGFEADHGLNPANSDSDGDSTLDPDEINPDTGNTYLQDQLGTDVTVSIDSSLPGWILGQSIGSNGWVKFTIEEWDGMGVWATIKEGGLEPENFTNSVANAIVAFATNIYNGGFRTLQLLLISTNHSVPMEIIVNDGGTYWAGQDPITYGPDIFAHFDAYGVELKSDDSAVNDEGYVYIAATPEMPDLRARLRPSGLPGQVSWRLYVEYTRNRTDEDYYPTNTWKALDATAEWDISSDLGAALRGGRAKLYFNYQGQLGEKIFHIRGENPSESVVAAEIGTVPWYAQPIAKWESDEPSQGRHYAQFNTVGVLGPNPDDYKWCPNRGGDGWGIMQLDTPAPSSQELWNWKANVVEGKARLADPCLTDAEAWIATQESQQATNEPAMGLTNYVFTFNGVDFQKGTDRTPVDACAIQRYNGAALWVIYWNNKTPTEPGSWEIRGGTYREYVDHVCGEVD